MPTTGRPTVTPFCAPTIAYQGSEKDVMNWNSPPGTAARPVGEEVADRAEEKREQ